MFKYNRVLTSQPQGAVEIDWSNPITRNLVFSFEAFAGKRDLVSGATGGAVGSGVTRGVGIGGVKYDFSGSQASGSFDFGVHHGMDGAKSCTFDILVYFNSSNPSGHFFGQWDGSFQEFLLSANGSGGLVWVPADGTGTGVTRTRFDGTGLFTTAGLYRIIASWRGGTDITVLVNGVDKTSSFSTVSSSATEIGSDNTSDKLQLGMVSGGSPLNGSIYFARCWRTGKSKVECVSLSKTPWQIFRPRTFLLGSLTSPQLLYPTGDVAGGTWLPSTGTDLFACIDETAASDADYIYTTVPGAYQEFSFPDGGAVDPSTGGHVRYRLPAGTGTITAILKQGSTTLQTLGTHTLTGSAQDIDITISASVANSDDLRVGFTASA